MDQGRCAAPVRSNSCMFVVRGRALQSWRCAGPVLRHRRSRRARAASALAVRAARTEAPSNLLRREMSFSSRASRCGPPQSVGSVCPTERARTELSLSQRYADSRIRERYDDGMCQVGDSETSATLWGTFLSFGQRRAFKTRSAKHGVCRGERAFAGKSDGVLAGRPFFARPRSERSTRARFPSRKERERERKR